MSSSIRFFSFRKSQSRASFLNDIHNPISYYKGFRQQKYLIEDYTINQEFNNNILYVHLPPLNMFEIDNNIISTSLFKESLLHLLGSLSRDYNYNLQFNCLISTRISMIKPKHSDVIYSGLSKYSTLKLRIVLFIEKHLGYYTGFSPIFSYYYVTTEYDWYSIVGKVISFLYDITYDVYSKPKIVYPKYGILLIVRRDIKDNTTITKVLDFFFLKTKNPRYR